ncbi:IQ calmodulin-binding motif protein [Pseudozyma hubeiensis]|nr:IQ calmodulin-binding motif protein [Pseudozyma hubeiensis]
MTSTQVPPTKETAADAADPPSNRNDETGSAGVDDFSRIDGADRIRSVVRISRLEKTLEEQRQGDKNDAASRWRRAGLMAEQLGKQDTAPSPAVKGEAATKASRGPARSTASPTSSPPASPPAKVNSLTQQLQSTSFFDKLPFSFKNDADKRDFIHESEVLTKRMEDQNWLEMLDPKHRYGSNLKHYHRYWNTKADTKQNFLHWLDEGEGKDLSLDECARSKLEDERISYLTADQRRNYMTYIDNEAEAPSQGHLEEFRAHLKSHPGKGRLRWCRTGQLVSTSKYDHGDLGKGRGVALRESQEWQDAIASGEVCEVVRDDKVKFRTINSDDSSDSFTSHSGSSNDAHSDDDAKRGQSHVPAATSTHATTHDSKGATHPDEKQQTRKEKLLEKANLGPKYLIKQKLGLYASEDRQQIVKGDSEQDDDQQNSASRPDALIRRRKADTWIFVADVSYNLYIGIKQRGRFQHSSLLAGSLVTVAGVLKVKDGVIVSIYPWSGHYRSSSHHFEEFIRRLQQRGLDTSQINVTKSKWVIEVVNRYGMYRKRKDRKLKDIKDKFHEALNSHASPQPTS